MSKRLVDNTAPNLWPDLKCIECSSCEMALKKSDSLWCEYVGCTDGPYCPLCMSDHETEYHKHAKSCKCEACNFERAEARGGEQL